MTPSITLTWWAVLATIGVLNIAAWLWSVRAVGWSSGTPMFVRAQAVLCGGYVIGCAYRSLFLVFDVPRLSMVDSWLASVAVGRTVATLAELCFAAQWALLLRQLTGPGPSRLRVVAHMLVPMIVVAELCSWLAVLTTSNLGHAIEESLWGVASLCVSAGLLAAASAGASRLRGLLASAGVLTFSYSLYMFCVDVPMYGQRWLADERAGKAYLGLQEGAIDIATRWVVSHRWEDWQSEVIWMSVYFSLGVWISISLIHVARLVRADAPPGTAQARIPQGLAAQLRPRH